MKYRINIAILVLMIALILVSCSFNTEEGVSVTNGNLVNDKADDEVTDNGTNEETKEDIMDKILINNDGSNTTLEDLSVIRINSDGTRVIDGRFSEYGFPDEDDFDGVSVKEIIERTLEQANKTGNYFVHFKGYRELPIRTVTYDTYHYQDEDGRFKIIHEEGEYTERDRDYSITVFDGEKYSCLLPGYYRNAGLGLPSGLSGAEVFEILKQRYMTGMDVNNGIVEGTNLDELSEQYDGIAGSAIEDSVSLLKVFSESDMGSFIRFKDGFKRGPDHYFGEDEDVYHIMYIKKNSDSHENGIEFDFYIDKETYLIRYQNGFMYEMKYTSTLENYSVDNEYPDDFFKIE